MQGCVWRSGVPSVFCDVHGFVVAMFIMYVYYVDRQQFPRGGLLPCGPRRRQNMEGNIDRNTWGRDKKVLFQNKPDSVRVSHKSLLSLSDTTAKKKIELQRKIKTRLLQ